MASQSGEVVQPAFPEGIDYYDPTHTACDSAATAYLMWRIGAPSHLWNPDAIDDISGRLPGKPSDNYMIFKNLLALLENGAEMQEITPFDPSKFLTRGLSYVEEHHKDDWLKEDPEDFYSYWAETLDDFTEATADFEERTHTDLRHLFNRVIRQPNEDDLRRFLIGGYAVKAFEKTKLFNHMVVATSIRTEDSGLYITKFDPDLAHRALINGPIVGCSLVDFCHRWIRDEGIIGVKPHLA